MFTPLKKTITKLETAEISSSRKVDLEPLINFIQTRINENQEILLNFICTHNSRRSHLSQIWAQTLANYFKIPKIWCYSGGTEATAMFYKVVDTLKFHGFQVGKLSESTNPIYTIRFNSDHHPIIGFSKKFDDTFNPQHQFAAIMTCSQADEGCPVIMGAAQRIPITYDDPKLYDNTPLQDEKYIERSLQIASEFYYIFSQIKVDQ